MMVVACGGVFYRGRCGEIIYPSFTSGAAHFALLLLLLLVLSIDSRFALFVVGCWSWRRFLFRLVVVVGLGRGFLFRLGRVLTGGMECAAGPFVLEVKIEGISTESCQVGEKSNVHPSTGIIYVGVWCVGDKLSWSALAARVFCARKLADNDERGHR